MARKFRHIRVIIEFFSGDESRFKIEQVLFTDSTDTELAANAKKLLDSFLFVTSGLQVRGTRDLNIKIKIHPAVNLMDSSEVFTPSDFRPLIADLKGNS